MILWALVLTSCIPAFMAHGLYVEHSSGDQFVVKIILIISVSAGAAVFLQPPLGILQARIPISTWIQI